MKVMTHAPLPDWRILTRSIFCAFGRTLDSAAVWVRDGDLAGWLSRSSWSLALIALWRKSKSGRGTLRVWLPAYFCNSSLVFLRECGAELVFYPLNDALAPDMSACKLLSQRGAVDIFLLVHYFGRPTPGAAAREFCALHGAWLVEDAAHVIRPVGKVGEWGDFVLYSPHKHLPIPDGALLVISKSGPSRFSDPLHDFGAPAAWADQLTNLSNRLGITSWRGAVTAAVWLLKRVLQATGAHFRRATGPQFAESDDRRIRVAPCMWPPAQTMLSRFLLRGLVSDIGRICRLRARNLQLWDYLLSCVPGLRSEMSDRPVNQEWVPYLGVYTVETTDAGQLYNWLVSSRVPVSTWPDLPEEISEAAPDDGLAWKRRHQKLYLPVHQSLLAAEVMGALPDLKPSISRAKDIEIRWDELSEERWTNLLGGSGRTSLLQSWRYGEAKRYQGWTPRRAVILSDGRPVGFAQILQKRLFGIFLVARLNRGPVWLPNATADHKTSFWHVFSRYGSIFRGRLLFVAPEMELSGESIAILTSAGFRLSSSVAYQSAWIDLGKDLDALRLRLDGKWRNMLVAAEKAGLELVAGTSEDLFEWMLMKYADLVKEKGFQSLPIELFRTIRKDASKELPMTILQATKEGNVVAGICIIGHGESATYLIGWNGPEGRKTRANQFLLWNAIALLKQTGFKWLDLGGFDDELNPGIASFKLGLNGERYRLVGEFVKW